MTTRPGPAWSNVPAALVADPSLSATGKLVALAIGVHTDSTLTATVSRSRLSDTASISAGKVKRGLRELIAAGWLLVDRTQHANGMHAVNTYRWNYRQAGLAVERAKRGRAVRRSIEPDSIGGGGVTSDPTRRVSSDPGGRVTSDPHTKEPNTKAAGRRRRAAEDPPPPSPERLKELLGPGSEWAKAKASLNPRGDRDATDDSPND